MIAPPDAVMPETVLVEAVLPGTAGPAGGKATVFHAASRVAASLQGNGLRGGGDPQLRARVVGDREQAAVGGEGQRGGRVALAVDGRRGELARSHVPEVHAPGPLVERAPGQDAPVGREGEMGQLHAIPGQQRAGDAGGAQHGVLRG
jgi:hypothetical protein